MKPIRHPAHLAQARARPSELGGEAEMAREAREILAKQGAEACFKYLRRLMAARHPNSRRNKPRCGARCIRDGHACQGPCVPGRDRCKWHGGLSTGPKTPEGKARSAANLSKTPTHRARARRERNE